ncbi:FAR1 DNA-binding domain [Sesbania bispinosa]|nr:FAR1 DNA-binding domain [Sesbania bispinosa]
MRGLNFGSKNPMDGNETESVQRGSCPFVMEDDDGGVFVVDENWVNSCAVEGEDHIGNSHSSENNGEFGDGFFCNDENGGVYLVGVDWNEEDEEGDGENCGEEKILIDTNDDILKMGDLSLFSPHEIEKYEFGNIDIAYKFYFEYGFANGFGIRKGRTLKNKKTLEEYQKELMCCRAGHREDRGLRLEDRVCEQKAHTMCDCKARFHIRVNKLSDRWFCICFEDEHNHDRLGAVHCSMLPVYRRMSDSDVVQMNNMMKVGIRPPNIFNTFASQSGGYEKIGFRKKDMYNKISEQRRSLSSDAKGALEYLGVASLYEKRSMWATAYLRGKIFGGFRTTSRCEGLHSELGKFVNSRYNLSDFLQHFQRCLNHMRFKEKEDDFTSIHGEPVIQTELGLPCEHIVVVLAHLGIDEIPKSLVLKRWSKAAKGGLGGKEFEANHCLDFGRSARRAALLGLYNHISEFKAATIEKFNVERERLVEDWRHCWAEIGIEQVLGSGGPNIANEVPRNPTRASTKGSGAASSSSGVRTRKKQNCSICKLPGHNKVTCPSIDQHCSSRHHYNVGSSSQVHAAETGADEGFEYFDTDSVNALFSEFC